MIRKTTDRFPGIEQVAFLCRMQALVTVAPMEKDGEGVLSRTCRPGGFGQLTGGVLGCDWIRVYP